MCISFKGENGVSTTGFLVFRIVKTPLNIHASLSASPCAVQGRLSDESQGSVIVEIIVIVVVVIIIVVIHRQDFAGMGMDVDLGFSALRF